MHVYVHACVILQNDQGVPLPSLLPKKITLYDACIYIYLIEQKSYFYFMLVFCVVSNSSAAGSIH